MKNVIESSKISEPKAPTKKNCKFSGWYKDNKFENKWNFNKDTVTKNTTLYAKWTGTGILVSSISLNVKETKTMEAKGIFALKATVKPANAKNKKVAWKSSNPKIVKINSKGKITAIRAGKATITAVASDGSGVKKSCTINVTKLSIKLNKKNYNIKYNDIEYYTIKTVPKNLDLKGAKIISSNKNVIKKAYVESKKDWVDNTQDNTLWVYNRGFGKTKLYLKLNGKKYFLATFECKKPKSKVYAKVDYINDRAIYNDLGYTFYNNTGKIIKYVELKIYQYDNRGATLKSPYSKYVINETIPPYSTDEGEFWVNQWCKSAKIVVSKVYYK